MAKPSHNRAFQAYNSDNYENRPCVKKPALLTSKESTNLEHISYSPIKNKAEINPSSSPTQSRTENMIKQSPLTSKRRLSTASLGQLLPARKGLPMTALATKRQNLWMSIAKNSQPNNMEPPIATMTPTTPRQTSLLRKKILRLLLVFSYLVSISLFAIALATFYGFFWSGYSPSKSESESESESTETMSDIKPTIELSIFTNQNSTPFGRLFLNDIEG